MDRDSRQLDAIILKCKQGDRAAFSELFQAIRTDVHRILVRTVGPDSELEDMLQAAFLEIFKSLKSFKGKSSFSTWMYRLVVNVAFQHLRKRKNRMPAMDAARLENEMTSPLADPEAHSLQRERVRIVQDILADMPPKKRLVFLLHEVDGYNTDEIADMLGTSRYTVKSRLFYARKDFGKKMRQKAVLLDEAAADGEAKEVE